MRQVVFGEWNDGGVALSSPDGSPPLDSARLCYLSPRDAVLAKLDIPRLPISERNEYVSYRLARIFPGDAGTALFDVLGQAPNGGPSDVIITTAACREAYATAAPRSLLACFYSFGPPPLPGTLRMVIGPGWTDAASFGLDGWSEARREEGDSAWESIIAEESGPQPPVPSPRSFQIICPPGKTRSIIARAESLGLPPDSVLAIDQDAAARSCRGMFREDAAQGTRRLSLAALVLGLSALLLFNIGIHRAESAWSEAASRDALRMRLLSEREASLKKAESRLEAIQSSNQSGPLAGPWELLSAISEAKPAGARILSFSLDRGRYSIEMESPNALETLHALSGIGLGSLILSNVSPAGSRERFTLSGGGIDARK